MRSPLLLSLVVLSSGLALGLTARAAAQARERTTRIEQYCSGQACFLHEVRCEDYRATRSDMGRAAPRCVRVPRSFCFSFYDRVDDDDFQLCSRTIAQCRAQLRDAQAANRRYYRYESVSECAPLVTRIPSPPPPPSAGPDPFHQLFSAAVPTSPDTATRLNADLLSLEDGSYQVLITLFARDPGSPVPFQCLSQEDCTLELRFDAEEEPRSYDLSAVSPGQSEFATLGGDVADFLTRLSTASTLRVTLLRSGGTTLTVEVTIDPRQRLAPERLRQVTASLRARARAAEPPSDSVTPPAP